MNINPIFFYVLMYLMITIYIAAIFVIGYAAVYFVLYLRKKMEKKE